MKVVSLVTVVAGLAALAVVGVGTAACGDADPNASTGLADTGIDPMTDGDGGTSSMGVDASKPVGTGQPGGDGGASDGAACAGFSSSSHFRCSPDGTARGKCSAGAADIETCARGCLREATTTDDVCMGTTTTWSCPGSYGTTKASNGDYYVTAFGCWKDAQGGLHGDPGDNCIPSCLAQAKSAGLCLPGDTGKQCEERVTWFTADAARFGCLARLEVTNPATGKSVIAVALDFGPSCSTVESTVKKAVLDASGRVDRELFGSDQGVSDHTLVHVVEVDAKTPLGPK